MRLDLNLFNPMRSTFVVLLFVLLACNPEEGQLDSVSIDKIENLIEVGNSLLKDSPSEAAKSFEKAKALAIEYNSYQHLAEVYKKLGYLYLKEKHFKKATENLKLALQKGQGEGKHYADIHYYLGILNQEVGEYGAAIANYKIASSWYESDGYSQYFICQLYIAIGICNVKLKAFDNAHDAYKKAEAIAKKNNLKRLLSRTYSSKGKLHLINEELNRALEAYSEALMTADNPSKKARDNHSLALTYKKLNNLKVAEAHYKASIELHQQLKASTTKVGVFTNYAELLLETGRAAAAQGYLEQAVALAQGLPYSEATDLAHQLLITQYKQAGQAQKALATYNQLDALKSTQLQLQKAIQQQNEQLSVQLVAQQVATAPQPSTTNYLWLAIALGVLTLAFLALTVYQQLQRKATQTALHESRAETPEHMNTWIKIVEDLGGYDEVERLRRQRRSPYI